MSTISTVIATIALLVSPQHYVASPQPVQPAPPPHVITSHKASRPVVYYAPRSANVALDAIAVASARWHVSYSWLLRIAIRESGLNPWAHNPSGASGLFQFMPSTYYAYAPRIGEFRSIFDPYANANVAAYMFSIGLSYAWN